MDEVTLQVQSNVDAPGLSRSRLKPLRSKLGSRYDDVLLVVSELVANSVRHGRTDEIGVRLEMHAGRICVEVTDDGPGFTMGDSRGEGLGLVIVENLADRWGLRDGAHRFTVWAELAVEPPTGQAD